MEGSPPQGVVQMLPVGFYTRGIIPGKNGLDETFKLLRCSFGEFIFSSIKLLASS
jgi:hypothetical protein